jgi:hypothetical protein
MGKFSRSHPSSRQQWDGKHRFEHWYCDTQVYLITARTRDGAPAFASDAAKAVFRDRFTHYTAMHRFEPWVVSLLANQIAQILSVTLCETTAINQAFLDDMEQIATPPDANQLVLFEL